MDKVQARRGSKENWTRKRVVFLKDVATSEDGSDLVEYSLLISFVAFEAAAGLLAKGHGTNQVYSQVISTLVASAPGSSGSSGGQSSSSGSGSGSSGSSARSGSGSGSGGSSSSASSGSGSGNQGGGGNEGWWRWRRPRWWRQLGWWLWRRPSATTSPHCYLRTLLR